MAELIIRDKRKEDAKAMVSLNNRCWRFAFSTIVPEEILIKREAEGEMRRTRMAQEDFTAYVAELGGQVVGYVGFGPEQSPTDEKERGEVNTLYVDPAFIGYGIGSALLEEALASLFESYEEVIIWTFADSPFKHFYEKKGGTLQWTGVLSLYKIPFPLIGYIWTK